MKNIQITTNHKRGGKAREKCVLSLDLKLVTEGVSLIEGGGSLQRRGAATAKALSPLCFNLVRGAATAKALSPLCFNVVRGTCRRPILHDLRDLGAEWRLMSSVIYGGARPFRALKTISRVFKLILCWMGNQWREARMGVI